MGSEVGKIVAVHFLTINDTLRRYVDCECFFELLVVMVLSVSHLVAFIRVFYSITPYKVFFNMIHKSYLHFHITNIFLLKKIRTND